MQMDIDDLDGGVTAVRLSGRMDTKGAADIDTQFSVIVGQRRAVMVDMSQVNFLASMGIRSLITGAKTLRMKGGKFAVFAPDGPVTATITSAGLDAVIPLFADRDSALAAVRG